MLNMRINQAGLDLIRSFEGCELTAYYCPAGVLTIGYGHTGPDVYEGMTITQTQAEHLLLADLAKFEGGVSQLVTVPMNGNQFSALVSFAYNVGLEAFRSSTLLRKLNAGDLHGAAAQFPRWNRAGGTVLPGLVRRRAAERTLFEARGLAASTTGTGGGHVA